MGDAGSCKESIMTAQRFIAPDMRRALRQVRDALGAEAVILSHRRVPDGIELLASSELHSGASMTQPATSGPLTPSPATEVDPMAFERLAPEPASSEWSCLQEEMRTMRALLEHQLSANTWSQLQQRRPAQAGMWRRLNRMGLDVELCRLLLAHFDEEQPVAESWQALMQDLSALLPVMESDPIQQGGVFAFVGPAGAGKTSCIAKLATRYALKQGSAGLVLVTTDHYRIGAQEQLRTVSSILGVPLLTARDEGELSALLYRLRHEQLVLVDTPGFARHDSRLTEQLAALDALGERVQVLQVLPATCQYSVIKADQHAYRCARLVGMILTKLDEAVSLGEPISLLVRRNLPLVYTTSGQNIPNDLAPAQARRLVASAIALARRQELDEQRLEQAMASITAP